MNDSDRLRQAAGSAAAVALVAALQILSCSSELQLKLKFSIECFAVAMPVLTAVYLVDESLFARKDLFGTVHSLFVAVGFGALIAGLFLCLGVMAPKAGWYFIGCVLLGFLLTVWAIQDGSSK